MATPYSHKCSACSHTTKHRSKRNAPRCSQCGKVRGAKSRKRPAAKRKSAARRKR